MRLFIDTAGWVALVWSKDSEHARAHDFIDHGARGHRFVTSEAVLSETVTVLRVRGGYGIACAFLDSLNSPDNPTEIVYTDSVLREEASDIFRKAHDQTFSFVDCLSFAIMRRMNLRDAFTFDEHFARFGFVMHPSAPPRRRHT